MAVIKEVTINTGSMTFDSIADIDAFIFNLPSLKKTMDVIKKAIAKGSITSFESTQLSPSSFYSKHVYPNQTSYEGVTAEIDPSGMSMLVDSLGWTVDRTISYTYD